MRKLLNMLLPSNELSDGLSMVIAAALRNASRYGLNDSEGENAVEFLKNDVRIALRCLHENGDIRRRTCQRAGAELSQLIGWLNGRLPVEGGVVGMRKLRRTLRQRHFELLKHTRLIAEKTVGDEFTELCITPPDSCHRFWEVAIEARKGKRYRAYLSPKKFQASKTFRTKEELLKLLSSVKGELAK
jgi:hypothetical protein